MQDYRHLGGVTPKAGSTAAGYFGGIVERYDSLIRRAVPRYDEMVTRLAEHLPELGTESGPGPRVLELGCGTGNLTLRLLARYPLARVLAVDAAPEMTELTRERAARAGAGARLEVMTQRFEALGVGPWEFDLVTSSLSLHHVKDKRPLYTAIARWLKPGRRLVFADQLAGVTDEVMRVHWDLWLRHCREPGHCTEEEIKGLEEHARLHDHYEPLEAHLEMMRSAGFVELDLMWRNGMYAVLGARRGN
jgi:ubiquinone/menaquinone biosynthesis C-methylase UbiE